MHFSAEQRSLLLDAARHAIRRSLAQQSPRVEPCPDDALQSPGGCFVSLHELRTHRLRGCVGRMDATQPLWTCVQQSAVNVLGDPRFDDDPVRWDELRFLEIEISVLSPMKPAASPLDFDPETHGIYLTHGKSSGCFLPQVARETGWSRQQLLERLCTEKMGLPASAWRDPDTRLLTFETIVIGPEPFELR